MNAWPAELVVRVKLPRGESVAVAMGAYDGHFTPLSAGLLIPFARLTSESWTFCSAICIDWDVNWRVVKVGFSVTCDGFSGSAVCVFSGVGLLFG